MLFSEHLYWVAVAFKMTEQVEQQICIKFCFKLEHSFAETIWMIQKAIQPVISSFYTTMYLLMHHVTCRVFWQNIKASTVTHPPLQPKFSALWLLAFPQTTITFEKAEISDSIWDSRKYNGAADGDSNKVFCSVLSSGRDTGRTVWGPSVPTVKGTDMSLSYVQCFLYPL